MTYKNGKKANINNELKPKETDKAPKVKYEKAKPGKKYTLGNGND